MTDTSPNGDISELDNVDPTNPASPPPPSESATENPTSDSPTNRKTSGNRQAKPDGDDDRKEETKSNLHEAKSAKRPISKEKVDGEREKEDKAAVPLTPTLTKRRRTVLSLADKADLIRRMRNGESQRQLAYEYGIGTSTVSDVKKHEAEILRYVEANGDFVAMNRRKLEAGAKVDVEEAVFEWLYKEVRAGKVLSSNDVMTKARAEHQRLRGNEEFRASTGWLERFKRRYNIKSFKPGEEDTWRPAGGSRSFHEDAPVGRVRRRDFQNASEKRFQRQSGKRDRSQENSYSPQPRIKSEVEVHDEFDYAEGGGAGGSEGASAEYIPPEIPNSYHHPLVSLEEGHLNLDLPPIEEIPSSGEAAGMLAKALVWAAAQPETTPQELFVLKQLQTKAALKCIMKAAQ